MRSLTYTQRFASEHLSIFLQILYRNKQIQEFLNFFIAMFFKKVNGKVLTAKMFQENFIKTVKSFLTGENAYTFMNSVKVSPAYLKSMFVLAMVKQLRIPSFF